MDYPFLSKTKILDTLKQKNANIRKSLGQNFLIDPNYIIKIVEAIQLSIPQYSRILEIGPGFGALTFHLKNHYDLVLVEIDRVLCEILKEYFPEQSIHQIDILEYIQNYSLNDFNFIIGNLPYYITTDIIINTIKSMKKPGICIFLVQKEYAEKLLEENNSISIYLNNFSKISKLFSIPKNAFFPIPQVESMLIKLEVFRETKCNPELLEKILRMSFRSKRKKMINSWQKGDELISISLLREKAEIISLDLTKRAEEIPKEAFYQLVNLISKD
jgi:16S rRNA (adenine1518-N6/adenine1519-N6)-dimethyltransferase